MLIEKVELGNIKSYGEPGCQVEFLPGVNLIWGDNGSGKTTILEAIGYCLFGAVEYNIGQFLREGVSSGQVVLTFQNQDDRRYEVIRDINSSTGNLKIRDLQTGRILHNRRSDAEAWLSEQLGVEFGKYGKDLFKNAIGVPQGKMTGSFGGTAITRKPVFDPILRVKEYDDADARLAKTKTKLTKLLSDRREERARLQGQVERIPGLEISRNELISQIAENRSGLAAIEGRLAQLDVELSNLSALKERLDKLESELNTARPKLSLLDEKHRQAEGDVQESEDAQAELQASDAGYRAHIAADSAKRVLEDRRTERDNHIEQMRGIEKRLGEIAALLEDIEKDLGEVSIAEGKASDLEPLVSRQSELEKRVQELDVHKNDCRRWMEQAKNIRQNASRDETRLNDLQKKLDRRIEVELRVEEIRVARIELLASMEKLAGEIDTLRSDWTKVSQEVQHLLLADQRRKSAESRQTALMIELDTLKDRLSRVEAEVHEKSTLLAEQKGLETKKTIEQENTAKAQAEIESCKQKLDELHERLAILKQAETAECPVCRAPLDEEHRRQVMTDFESERMNIAEKHQAARQAKKQADEEVKRIQVHLVELQKRLGVLASEHRAVELRQEIEAKQAEIKDQELTLAETAEVPDQLLAREKVRDDLNSQITSLNDVYNEEDVRKTGLEQDLSAFNKELAVLPQSSQFEELKNSIQKANNEAEQLEEKATALASVEQELYACQNQLAILGDPRTDQAHHKGVASRRKDLETRRENLSKECSSKSETRKVVEQSLSAYATLDQELAQASRDLTKTDADYRRYIAHEKIASALDGRKKALAAARSSFEGQRQIFRGLETNTEQVRKEYDPAYHETVKAEANQKAREMVRINTQIEGWDGQLSRVNIDLEELYQKREQYNAVNREVARLEKLNEVFDFVRKSIKQAGPNIVRQRVRAVSASADHIFQEILGDLSLAMKWDETYAIKVRCGGQERDFEQLSGGEQMAAAIAVRLALMLHMADNNLRWLFLDEPTANMDDKRRDKLADRITRWSSFTRSS